MSFPQGNIFKKNYVFRMMAVAICAFSLMTASFAQLRGGDTTKAGRSTEPAGSTKTSGTPGTFSTAEGPFFLPGDPSCKLLNDLELPEYDHITEDWQMKLEIDVPNGQFPFVEDFANGVYIEGGLPENPNIFLNIGSTGNTVNFWSIGPLNLLDRAVSAIIVQGPIPGGHIYTYPNLSVGDTGPFITPDGFDIVTVKLCLEAFSGPSSAPVSVSGRAITTGGLGIGNARIEIRNLSSGETRVATTNPFGYYQIDKLTATDLYMVTISHKRHQFFDPQRTFTLDEDLTGLDFVSVW